VPASIVERAIVSGPWYAVKREKTATKDYLDAPQGAHRTLKLAFFTTATM
jgi:hypothetical protein